MLDLFFQIAAEAAATVTASSKRPCPKTAQKSPISPENRRHHPSTSLKRPPLFGTDRRKVDLESLNHATVLNGGDDKKVFCSKFPQEKCQIYNHCAKGLFGATFFSVRKKDKA